MGALRIASVGAGLVAAVVVLAGTGAPPALASRKPGSWARPAGTWNADPVHSTVGFEVGYSGVSTFRGSFRDDPNEQVRFIQMVRGGQR